MSRRGQDLDRFAELEDERRFLLRSLDDLDREHDAGDVDEADYTALRDGYTARAATVIREIDAGQASLERRTPVRWGRVAGITAVVLALGIGSGWLVAHYSGQNVPDPGAQPVDKVEQLLAAARQLGPGLDKLKAYDAVLAEDPRNVEALTYRGWTLRIVAASLPTAQDQAQGLKLALAALKQAAALDPTYPDAQCFMAVTTFRDLGDAAGAKAYLQKCQAANPPGEVLALVQQLSADIGAALAGGGTPTTSVPAPSTT